MNADSDSDGLSLNFHRIGRTPFRFQRDRTDVAVELN
jgi:hypothetical protein